MVTGDRDPEILAGHAFTTSALTWWQVQGPGSDPAVCWGLGRTGGEKQALCPKAAVARAVAACPHWGDALPWSWPVGYMILAVSISTWPRCAGTSPGSLLGLVTLS